MKLTSLSNNKYELVINNISILFSYIVPVACWQNGVYYKTSKKWSNTTTLHINSWVHLAIKKPQEYFDNLVKGY